MTVREPVFCPSSSRLLSDWFISPSSLCGGPRVQERRGAHQVMYVPRDAIGELSRPRTLVWVDRQGREVPIRGVTRRNYWYPRLSSDGTRVALTLRDQAQDIWIWHLANETLERLTREPTFEQIGVCGHDGKTVIYPSSTLRAPSAPRSLFRRSADSTGPAEIVIPGTVGQFPSSVIPDGTALSFRAHTPSSKVGAGNLVNWTAATPFGTDLYLLPLAGEHRPRPLLAEPFDELNGEVSLNGQWLAYESNESGWLEVYVRSFPNVDAWKRQVSTNGARNRCGRGTGRNSSSNQWPR